MRTEIHSIKKFRGSNLGIIRLDLLAYPKDMVVKIGEEEFIPIAYDTYWHPIISEASFTYYQAIKAIKERRGENLIVRVQYKHRPFSVKDELYNTLEAIENILSNEDPKLGLKELKKILIWRKQASFSSKDKELNSFILYGTYLLHSDGRVYMCTYDKMNSKTLPDVISISEVTNLQRGKEVHIPSHEDVCAICGKFFDLNDVKNIHVTEDEKCRKVHTDCLKGCTEALELQQASRIIDSVYDDVPVSEIIRKYDTEDQKEKVWYLYHTKQGDVAIRFKNKVIEIKWYGNFKPFNLEKLFEEEDVTKRREDDSKIIHAWSSDDAKRYLTIVKNS